MMLAAATAFLVLFIVISPLNTLAEATFTSHLACT